MENNNKITSCVIRKNTKKLRRLLIANGFLMAHDVEKPNKKAGLILSDNGKIILGMPADGYTNTINGGDTIDDYIKSHKDILDCGKDDELFIKCAIELKSIIQSQHKKSNGIKMH